MDNQQLNKYLLSNNPPQYNYNNSNQGNVNPSFQEQALQNQYHQISDAKKKLLKIPLLKRSLYLLIFEAYAIYLVVAGACLIYLFSSVPVLCNKYSYFFIPLFCSFLVLITGALLNIFTIKIRKSKQTNTNTISMFIFGLGGLARLGWVIWSIIIYDQNYGDCYLPYKNQLGMIICSGIEILFVWIIHCTMLQNEKKIQSLGNR